jgi:hypothetical protein
LGEQPKVVVAVAAASEPFVHPFSPDFGPTKHGAVKRIRGRVHCDHLVDYIDQMTDFVPSRTSLENSAHREIAPYPIEKTQLFRGAHCAVPSCHRGNSTHRAFSG